MLEENRVHYEKIKALVSNYEEGEDIFKPGDPANPRTWETSITPKAGIDDPALPKEWLALVENAFAILAKDKYNLDTFRNRIYTIGSKQMLEAYASSGMPYSYPHWSYGLVYEQQKEAYDADQMNLAYEIVINSNPSIAYCMEDNSRMMMMLVISHASFGHNWFFKNNHMFTQHTQADEILGDMERLSKFVIECEEKYGVEEVEKLIDACHALASHGVNRYKKPVPRTPQQEEKRRALIEEARQQNVNDVMDRTIPKKSVAQDFKAANDDVAEIPGDMEENVLRYVASYAPHLKPWKREIMKMIGELNQYFYPQRQTKVMNEGCATLTHYNMMTDMHDMGFIDDGMFLEFIHSHSGVVRQPPFDHPGYSGFNPYALGFAILQDIVRICQDPTEEDREWFPQFAGNPDWQKVVYGHALRDFKDESFILQYLSPKVIRDFKMFAILDDDKNTDHLLVTGIHDDHGYRQVRSALAASYNLGDGEPRIEVAHYDYQKTRTLTLHHTSYNRKPLDEKDTVETLKHIYQLWGHPVVLDTVDENGKVIRTLSVPTGTTSPYKPKLTPT